MLVLLHPENCKKKKDQLTYFKGFLPFDFDVVINRKKRREYLQKIGLWEEVHLKEMEVVKGMRESKPNDDIYMESVLKQWLIENPQFQDCIIFKE